MTLKNECPFHAFDIVSKDPIYKNDPPDYSEALETCYQIVLISNLTATKPGYEITINYSRINSDEVFSLPLDEFLKKGFYKVATIAPTF